MSQAPTRHLPLAVSMGDACGIGPDIILAAWSNRHRKPLPSFLVIGSSGVLSRRAEMLEVDLAIGSGTDKATADETLTVIETENEAVGQPANPQGADALAAIEAIDTAVSMAVSGTASGVVTAPVNKKNLMDAGFRHPGHTEYLAELSLKFAREPVHPVMMIAGPQLRTVPVTVHIPLAQVKEQLSRELIETTCRIVATDLKQRFGITHPRIAVSGLNPHAGESGLLGDEDGDVIFPAVEGLKSEGLDVRGPLPADTMFHERARETYDVAVCMYHDQALIPAKTLGFDDAVNVTLGLPFIRTSPDHGTAYDLAGTGRANPASFIAALEMAAEMARHQ